MKVRKLVLYILLTVVVIAVGMKACTYLIPTYRVKSLIKRYNHWTDPGLVRGKGLTALFRYYLITKRTSHRLNKLLSPDFKLISKFSDGRAASATRDDLINNLRGMRFVVELECILLEGPEVERKQGHFVAKMKKAYRDKNKIEIMESELIVRDVANRLVITEDRCIIREADDNEMREVTAIVQAGRYDPEKGLAGRYRSSPSFSPDGSEIVFCSLRHKSADIYTVDVDGSNLRRLTSTKYWEAQPIFTPDGKSIMFISDKDNYAGELYLIDLDGSNYRKLVPDYYGVADAVYSPDGKYAAFCAQDGWAREVYTMTSDGTDIQRLTDSDRENSSLIFSADVQKIYFKQKWYEYDKDTPLYEEIYSVNIDGSSLKQLTHDRKSKTPVAAALNGILFMCIQARDDNTPISHQPNLNELWWMKPDSGTAERVLGGGRTNGTYADTKVLPDNRSIVFVDDRQKAFRYELHVKKLFGTKKIKQLTKRGALGASDIAVSPDGKYVVYVAPLDGKYAGRKGYIRLVPIDGGEIKTICKNY